MEINGIGTLLNNDSIQKNGQEKDYGFGDILKETLNSVNSAQLSAEKMSQDFILGNNVELHQVILATEKASLALQLTMQVKNKVMEAYQEIMRMQV